MSNKKTREQNSIIEGIENFLKKLELTEEDFKGKIGGTKKAHKKITEEALSKWRETHGFNLAKIPFSPRGGTYGIDVIGRDSERGKILMSIEVDTGHLPYSSWMKLLDIRSNNKIWIYATNHPEQKAKTNFKESIGEITSLINAREEDKSLLGNIVVFLKTPTIFQKETINLTS